MRLPRTTIREFYKAIDDAHPPWAKAYIWLIGVPAWVYIAYRVLTADSFQFQLLDEIAFAAFFSAAIISTVVLFRAFWRNEL